MRTGAGGGETARHGRRWDARPRGHRGVPLARSRGGGAGATGPGHHGFGGGGGGDRALRARRGDQLRRVHGRRRRGGRRGGRDAGQRRGRGPACWGGRKRRRQGRVSVERFRLRRLGTPTVCRIGHTLGAVGVRALQAGRRDLGCGRQSAALHSPVLVAVRAGRQELRRDDAAPRQRADRDPRRLGPGRLPHVHTPSRSCARSLARWARGVPGGARAGGRRVRILVAGGAGFIGSAYVHRRLAAHPGDEVRVLDKLTYAGRTENLEGLSRDQVELVEGDIADADMVSGAVEGCDAIVNFAAESHVDRSIHSPGEFIQTDVFGAFVLLEAAREKGIRHLQVSTDEVYGSIPSGSFTEASTLQPSSPYSASKAGGDLIVGAYHHTYGADALVVRGSNNYGPRQHPEKLIPLAILNALAGDPIPVYGDGLRSEEHTS